MPTRVKGTMFIRNVQSIILFAVCLIAGPVRATDGTAPDKLTADFHMTRTLSALKDSVQSTGRLVMGGPGLLRWETRSPAKSLLIVNHGKGWLHYPDLKVTKGFDVSTDPVMKVLSEHLLALTGGNLQAVASMYEIRVLDGGARELLPKKAEIQKLFSKLRVATDRRGAVSKVELISKNGDRTVIEFSNVTTPSSISPALFEKP